MSRIILDTDIGTDVDDAMALALAMKAPEITIEGVTTVYGDVKLRAKLAKKLLQLGNRKDVSVYAGIVHPLLHNREIWWPGHEGEGVLSDDEKVDYESTHAVDFIIETIMKNPGKITLVPIGPLTNIAAAIIREPKIVKNVKEIVLMGGVTRLADNAVELPQIEHNIKCDPEAASLVFSCDAPIVMVGLDVTKKVTITREDNERLATSGKPLNEALSKLVERWLDVTQRDWCVMHDPLAVSLLIDRSLVETRKMKVHVEYDHRHPTGQTVATLTEDGNVEVCLGVENERFISLLLERLLLK
jgi:purine nucleosidase